MNKNDLIKEWDDKIAKVKLGLINPNANNNNTIGLIGSDAARLRRIEEYEIEKQKDLKFFFKQ